ncbi:Protein CBG27306 [Caenorhabditis briggsae]|uniref:Protein CBG27306 n=1 Tax=Caenorhabditis briggsae TaxID=6238 RepID=B6IKX7_CAEBR|nr:Protein CBG27306 [Caenorhabditis briggsae]CAS00557.1 Protein CBG27306 [Caenorhabditis briggsae]
MASTEGKTALLESPHLKYWRIDTEVTRGVTFENFLKKCGARFYPDYIFFDTFRCPIPDSDDFFEIRFFRKLGLPENNWMQRGPRLIYSFTEIERKSNSA